LEIEDSDGVHVARVASGDVVGVGHAVLVGVVADGGAVKVLGVLEGHSLLLLDDVVVLDEYGAAALHAVAVAH